MHEPASPLGQSESKYDPIPVFTVARPARPRILSHLVRESFVRLPVMLRVVECGNEQEKCSNILNGGKLIFYCDSCGTAQYCSLRCQVLSFMAHRKICNLLASFFMIAFQPTFGQASSITGLSAVLQHFQAHGFTIPTKFSRLLAKPAILPVKNPQRILPSGETSSASITNVDLRYRDELAKPKPQVLASGKGEKCCEQGLWLTIF